MSRSSASFSHISQFNSKLVVTLLQLVLVTVFLNAKILAVIAAPSPDLGDDLTLEEKRSNWQSLQGAWGKRALSSSAWSPDAIAPEEVDDHWVPLLISNGERTDPFLKYSMVYLTNAGTLDRLLSQREESDPNVHLSDELVDEAEGNGDDNALMNEKRTWKNMNAAWGKRRQAPAWNKFRGAWGKREPGWNNLKGMWGKRSSNWQKLQGGWGKRAALN